MAFRIAHLSDTHLGFTDLDRVTAAGVNQREEDCYRVYREAVEKIIGLAPDTVVHTGDFFHRPCPSNRALIEALAGLKRLSQAGIPTVIIAGNHSTPRTVYTSPILESFKSLDNVHPIFRERLETVTLRDSVFHGLPHVNDEDFFRAELLKAAPVAGKANVFLLHTSIGMDFLMEEYGERVFPKELLPRLDAFSYVALGHFHNAHRIQKAKSAWYSGSTERFSEKEAGREKGFLLVTLPEKGAAAVEFIGLSARPWRLVTVESCQQKTVAEIRAEIRAAAAATDPAQAIISLRLLDLKPVQSPELSNHDLSLFFPGALVVLSRRTFVEETFSFVNREVKKESLLELFTGYAREKADTPAEAELLAGEARHFFAEHERRETEKAGTAP